MEQGLLIGTKPLNPSTESIKYIGSKLKIIPHILRLVEKTGAENILDGFSGSTRVSQALAKCGYKVTSNDIATWSRHFGNCYLKSNRNFNHYNGLINHLNSLKPIEGWFTENYGGLPNGGSAVQNDGLKKPWQIHNTMKLDAIREEIDRINLDDVEKSVALTSLILALDKVDNTLGHFVSYLKKWSARSYNEMKLEVPKIFNSSTLHEVYQDDIFNIAARTEYDLAYYDPPYGSNNEKMPPSRVRYASYYHIWKTICDNDRPKTFGKARRRFDTSDRDSCSIFEEYKKNSSNRFVTVEAIENLIQTTNAKWIILSYSSGGRATAEELHLAINNTGKLHETVEVDYKKNVMAAMKWTNEWLRDAEEPNKEFLFLIQKT